MPMSYGTYEAAVLPAPAPPPGEEGAFERMLGRRLLASDLFNWKYSENSRPGDPGLATSGLRNPELVTGDLLGVVGIVFGPRENHDRFPCPEGPSSSP